MPVPQPSKKVEPKKAQPKRQPSPAARASSPPAHLTPVARPDDISPDDIRPDAGPDPTRTDPPREITDPKVMRALAHPIRWALLEAIRRDGEITATRAAELLGDSPGNMSWHLQTLAKYGFVEEAPGNQGRSRPWRAVSRSNRFDTSIPDPESASAGEALEVAFMERNLTQMHEWRAQRHAYSVEWLQASFITDTITYLTHEEVAALSEELREIFGRYTARKDKKNRPEGALPVHLLAYGHPLPPTPSGN